MLTRTLYPNDGPAYSLVDRIKWDCPHDKLFEVATIIEGAFRAAPEDKIGSELFKLRMLTRGREQRDASDQEAENIIWIEQLRCWPGDIVMEVLRTWPARPNGQWWPTWHEVQDELKRRCDRRQALLNFVKALANRPEPVMALEDRPPTPEQRARAVDHWEQVVRPDVAAREETVRPIKETPEKAFARLEAMKDRPVVLGGELAKKIEAMKPRSLGERLNQSAEEAHTIARGE